MSMELMVIAVLVALNALSLGQSYAMRQRIIVLETINGEMARRLASAIALGCGVAGCIGRTTVTMDQLDSGNKRASV